MKRIWRASTLASVSLVAIALTWPTNQAKAQGVSPSTSPARINAASTTTTRWAGYATNRARTWYAYTSQPSAWSNYVYRGTASSGVNSGGAPDVGPRHVAYGYQFNPATSHWEHPGYGGKIPNYGQGGKYTELPRPWLWWGSRNY